MDVSDFICKIVVTSEPLIAVLLTKRKNIKMSLKFLHPWAACTETMEDEALSRDP